MYVLPLHIKLDLIYYNRKFKLIYPPINSVCIVRRIVYIVRCIVYNVRRVVCIVRRTVYNVRRVECLVRRTMYNARG